MRHGGLSGAAAFCSLLLGTSLIATAGVAAASDPDASGARTPSASAKLDSGLLVLADAAARGERVDGSTTSLARRLPGGERTVTQVSSTTVTDDGEVLIDAYASGPVADAAAALRRVGMRVTTVSDRAPQRLVEGWLPADALVDAAALPEVRAIVGAYGGTNAGSVTSQGDAAHHAPAARALGVDGTGVKVGVISDSINRVGGGVAASQASGDLPGPASVPAGSVTILTAPPEPVTGIDEGRAMAEIVYDLAPGVRDMVFGSGLGSGPAGKAASIDGLVAAGVDVITDDIFFSAEPFFQDGIITQATDRAAAAGVVYVTSAGNKARQAWEDVYRPVPDPSLQYPTTHDFDPGPGVDTVQQLGSFSNVVVRVSLQWAEPWGGATSDFAVAVWDGNTVAYTVDNENLTTGLPREFIGIQVPAGSPRNIGISIRRKAGTGTPILRHYQFGVPAGQLVEHADPGLHAIDPDSASAVGAISTAAVLHSTPTTPEDFSSRGPAVVHYFDDDGTPFATPEVRPKPDVAGADGVATTVPNFNPFFGTSAASPHIAAIAALILDARPASTVADVRAILTDPRVTTPCTSATPVDDCGAGFVLADEAVAIALDVTGPVLKAVTTPAKPNGKNGWYTTKPKVGWAVADAESPLRSSSGCGLTTITQDGKRKLTCTATSFGGTTTTTFTIKRDASAPTKVHVEGIKKSYPRGSAPVRKNVKCKASDPTSGIASCTIAGFSTARGKHTLTLTATNKAGLRRKATFTYVIG